MLVCVLTVGMGEFTQTWHTQAKPQAPDHSPSHAIAKTRVWENGDCFEVNTQAQSTLHQYLILSTCFECNWLCLI